MGRVAAHRARRAGPDRACGRLHLRGRHHAQSRARACGWKLCHAGRLSRRYAQYRMDPALQAAHAASPWIAPGMTTRSRTTIPASTADAAEDPAAFLKRRAAGYQAYFENLPLPPSAQPGQWNAALASRRIGTLAEIFMLDQRQYRSAQACPPPGRAGGNRVGDASAPSCAMKRAPCWARHRRPGSMRASPARGAAGTCWRRARCSRIWTSRPARAALHHRQLERLFAARQRLLDGCSSARVDNPVVLSGDIHSFIAGNIRARPEQPDSPLWPPRSSPPRCHPTGDRRSSSMDGGENPDLLLAEAGRLPVAEDFAATPAGRSDGPGDRDDPPRAGSVHSGGGGRQSAASGRLSRHVRWRRVRPAGPKQPWRQVTPGWSERSCVCANHGGSPVSSRAWHCNRSAKGLAAHWIKLSRRIGAQVAGAHQWFVQRHGQRPQLHRNRTAAGRLNAGSGAHR